MYFLNDLEKKYLVNHLLKVSRKVGVSEELRGWSWYREPLHPYHAVRLPMYAVCSRYCSTARDVYVRFVLHEKGELSPEMVLGADIHKAVSSILASFKEESDSDITIPQDPKVQSVAEYVETEAKSALLHQKTKQPYATKSDILHTSIPFLVEHRISGELLGLSDVLSIDAVDYLHDIIFDLKVGKKRDFYRLYSTGYALVFESIYEVPMDIGCTVYVDFRNDQLHITKDLFHISDNLRSWWIEERDTKMELVSNSEDPGRPEHCPGNCMYYFACR